MEDVQLLINCDGHWEGSIYKSDFSETTVVHRKLMYEDLLSTVHEIVYADRNSFDYEMKSLLNTVRNITRFKIKNIKIYNLR